VIGGIAPYSGTGGQPEVEQAAQAAVQWVNVHGGINGRPLVYKACDDQNQQTLAANCANKLMKEDHIVALAGQASSFDQAITPVMAATGVPMLGIMSDPPATRDSPNTFSFHPTSAAFATAAYIQASELHPKKAAIISFEGAQLFVDAIEIGYRNAGVTDFKVITYPFTVTNFGPILQQVKDSGAQVYSLVSGPDQITQMVAASKQLGIDIPIALCDCSVNGAALKAISDSSIKNSIGMGFNQQSPGWKVYLESLKQYAPNVVADAQDSLISNAWVTTYLFATKIAPNLKDITPQTVIAYLKRQKAFESDGLMPPLDYTKPGTWSEYPNKQNLWAYPGTVKDGKEVQLSTTPVKAFKDTANGL
jgi:branched-chain amino acid transport system substrate-binding protein